MDICFSGSPKSLQQLCVLAVREAVGNAKGWPQLTLALKQLEFMNAPLPPIIMDLLLFSQVWLFRSLYMLEYFNPLYPDASLLSHGPKYKAYLTDHSDGLVGQDSISLLFNVIFSFYA